ncbi:hypothetical protein BCR37DRAFT_251510 [Protomyces lactucae-debilis]|uniref:Probable endonuclease LCL3 n=1 Tax=Protomyces lactucae-debilis TaxID=2754530 RepID=A0A1Y2FLB4_PROLT|nr:uncharacterized protein BCR37DRAFT_251510 [Protomyces lactucae-debilis]ORY84782.1 hypothetical protein BCR37DRAFT_251510 [Protomyces lactucae-debilis]
MPWPWQSESAPVDGKKEALAQETNTVLDPRTWLDTNVLVPVLLLTSASLGAYHFYRRGLRRYPTIDHLPAQIYGSSNPKARSRSLLGYVTSVGDGDNFRFFHTPGGRLTGWGWLRSVPTDKKALRNQTIHVRIAGIDAPELAHFGNPAQPFGKEALDWLASTVLHKRVRVRIHSRDRFDRVVGNPEMRQWPFIWIKRDVGLEQIKAGMATVFRQGGAEYGGLMDAMERAEGVAKAAKKGMWSQGKKLETPAAYKKRTRGEDHEVVTSKTPKMAAQQNNSLLAWLKWSIGK